MGKPIKYGGKQLAGLNFEGYRQLSLSLGQRTIKHTGLRWSNACVGNRGNCCGTLSFEAKTRHSSPDQACRIGVTMFDLLHTCASQNAELEANGIVWPGAAWQTYRHRHEQTIAIHTFQFSVTRGTLVAL